MCTRPHLQVHEVGQYYPVMMGGGVNTQRSCVTNRGDLRWKRFLEPFCPWFRPDCTGVCSFNHLFKNSKAQSFCLIIPCDDNGAPLVPAVPSSLPLSLPVDMAVIPQSWRFLPLSQAELGPLFSNSSPFSFSQSLFIVPPHHHSPPASLQASFGPYSVTQVSRRQKSTLSIPS